MFGWRKRYNNYSELWNIVIIIDENRSLLFIVALNL